MNKPLSIARKEFIEKVALAANESGLPAYMMYDILRGILGDLKDLVAQQEATELKAMEEGASDESE